jgi:hypothetical protein
VLHKLLPQINISRKVHKHKANENISNLKEGEKRNTTNSLSNAMFDSFR